MVNYDLRSCSVVGPSDPLPSERNAVEEARRWISEIVGEGAGEPKTGVKLEYDPELGPESFRLEAGKDGIAIAGGRPRGILYGVYEMLDRFVGVRWLAADETLLPDGMRFSIPEAGFEFRPALEYREPFFTEAFDGEWSARNRMNSSHAKLTETHGGKVTYVGFVHTFNQLLPPEEFFPAHPDYYSEIDGRRISERTQLCLTNADVVRIAGERALSWLRENPGANIVSVSQNDWRNPCQCRECSRIDEEEGTHAGSLLHFVNQVAEIIEAEFPGVWVDTLAYTYTRHAPRTVRPRRNVVVRLCSIECCFSHPLASCPENSSFKEDTEDWARVAHTLHVWDYVTNFSHYIMPFPNLRVLKPNIQFFVSNNVRGIFEEGNYSEGGHGEFAALRSYLLARALWQPDCDLDSALDEFLHGYYGNAAGPIREYIDALHDRTEARNLHVRIYSKPEEFLDLDFLRNCQALLDEAESRAEARTRGRVRIERLPLQYATIRLTDVSDPERKRMLKDFIAECRSAGISHISEGTTLDEFEKGHA
jgi:hypothetical protein